MSEVEDVRATDDTDGMPSAQSRGITRARIRDVECQVARGESPKALGRSRASRASRACRWTRAEGEVVACGGIQLTRRRSELAPCLDIGLYYEWAPWTLRTCYSDLVNMPSTPKRRSRPL